MRAVEEHTLDCMYEGRPADLVNFATGCAGMQVQMCLCYVVLCCAVHGVWRHGIRGSSRARACEGSVSKRPVVHVLGFAAKASARLGPVHV
jgi:N-acetylglutamate synthase-like GNAT family acetyltransferase